MKRIVLLTLALGSALAFAGCQATDIVGKVAVTSFESVLAADEKQVVFDEEANGWALSSPGGERFIWGKDFSSEEKADFAIELDATPFVNAGLDASKLDPAMYLFDETSNTLVVYSEIGTDDLNASDSTTALESFKANVKTYRESIGYHEKLDHYGVKLGGGNMFEWAKDMSTNDLDIVFVLDPKALIDAGVDPTQVTDWKFAQVEVMDDQGKEITVDKFLKPYNLK